MDEGDEWGEAPVESNDADLQTMIDNNIVEGECNLSLVY